MWKNWRGYRRSLTLTLNGGSRSRDVRGGGGRQRNRGRPGLRGLTVRRGSMSITWLKGGRPRGGVRRRGCPDPPLSASGQRSNSRVDLENNQVPSLAHRRVEKTHKSLLLAIPVGQYVCSRFSGQTPPGGSMKRHPSPGASGRRQLPRGMSEARTVGSPPYYPINGWRLRRAAVRFKSWSVGPAAPLKITLSALSRAGRASSSRSRLVADRGPRTLPKRCAAAIVSSGPGGDQHPTATNSPVGPRGTGGCAWRRVTEVLQVPSCRRWGSLWTVGRWSSLFIRDLGTSQSL